MPNHLVTEVQDLGFPVGLKVDQVIADGGITLGDEPGLGIEVDEAAISAQHDEASWAIPDGPHVRPQDAGLRLALPHPVSSEPTPTTP